MQENKALKIGYVQTRSRGSKEENMQYFRKELIHLAQKGAQVVVSQELFLSNYFCQSEDESFFSLSEAIPGPSSDELSQLAKEYQICIVASLFERRQAGLYHNTTVVLGPNGDLLGRYRKMHIPDDPLFYEKYYFTPGDLGFQVVQTPFAKLGILICWDQWFPEAARLMALSGAELLIYPTAIAWSNASDDHVKQRELSAWQTIQRSHAIANGVYVLAVNRVGREGELDFWGNSFLCDPMGEILIQSDEKSDQSQIVEIDLSRIEKTRQIWPFFRDRRIDAYSSLLKRFNDE